MIPVFSFPSARIWLCTLAEQAWKDIRLSTKENKHMYHKSMCRSVQKVCDHVLASKLSGAAVGVFGGLHSDISTGKGILPLSGDDLSQHTSSEIKRECMLRFCDESNADAFTTAHFVWCMLSLPNEKDRPWVAYRSIDSDGNEAAPGSDSVAVLKSNLDLYMDMTYRVKSE
jgi:hypothetical protein